MLKHLQARLQGAGFTCLATVSLTEGGTDNKGNTYILRKFYTNRWPSAAILMEAAAIMLTTESHMNIGHVPRERNQWADDLANFILDGFDPAKRWDPIQELGDTIVLVALLKYGRQLGFHLSKKEREDRGAGFARLTPASLTRPFQGRPSAGGANSSPVKRKR